MTMLRCTRLGPPDLTTSQQSGNHPSLSAPPTTVSDTFLSPSYLFIHWECCLLFSNISYLHFLKDLHQRYNSSMKTLKLIFMFIIWDFTWITLQKNKKLREFMKFYQSHRVSEKWSQNLNPWCLITKKTNSVTSMTN